MSRPKHYWYGIVQKMVYRYPRLSEDNEQERQYKTAIDAALEQIEAEENGAEKIRAIRMVCFERRYTLDGAAQKLHYSHNTIQRWINRFINQVGKNAGF